MRGGTEILLVIRKINKLIRGSIRGTLSIKVRRNEWELFVQMINDICLGLFSQQKKLQLFFHRSFLQQKNNF